MPTANPTEKLTSEIHKTNRLLGKKQAFYRGLLGGLGASLGATLLLAIVLWILSQLEYLPLIGEIAKPANDAIKNSMPK